ncbi:uncharacterized protein LOC116125491 [Pistacia vera]|uniref:uncharacterized protein LOC116125491 n=1 Tax=Pistacia vera TaxID=55513 RepID=UPI0012631483|nr:uncharacterized protein LOC116125491 [Pistacia vera]XP_031267069.1 uncharacterized protein LOC116125491 [Pistacia vera]
MAEAEILELFELRYSDLKLLASSSSSSSSSKEDVERLETIRANIMESLGPRGPGLLSITGVPKASNLRRNLLPLARKLALLNPDHRKRIFKDHNLGSDVPLKNPERNVSSFAMQLRYEQGGELDNLKSSDQDLPDDEFKNLGNTFKELGFCMMELGLCLAQICDKAIGGQELEHSLLESCTAKGRLIHYHSILDNIVLKEAGRKSGSSRRQANRKNDLVDCITGEKKQREHTNVDVNSDGVGLFGTHSNLWQQWHYDYGIFTVLTDPLFILSSYLPENTEKEQYTLSCDKESPSPSGHTCLQIFDPSKNKVRMVKSSSESFIIQVGESADILTKGRLRSTLHCVCRPAKLENLSRETFVMFLQPAWSKTFSMSDYPTQNCNLDGQCSGVPDDKRNVAEQDGIRLTEEIRKIIPPLSLRLKDGMTFADFSCETTKQYYGGGGGLQSNR